MSVNINSGLLPPIIKKEVTYGVAPLDFNLHDGSVKGIPVNQALESPVNVVDSYQKEVIKSTFGSQVQKDSVIMLGNRSVTASFGHQIFNNDFVAIAGMVFQNGYTYTPGIVDATIISVSSLVDVVTIEITVAGALKDGDKVIISGRTLTSEDGTYTVSNVVGTSFDITYVGGFDTDITGIITDYVAEHSMLIEDVNDCNAQELDNSYSIYLPSKFPDTDGLCGTSQGELFSGVAVNSLNIDFVEATYNLDVKGKSLEDYGIKSPRDSDDYLLPVGKDNPMRKNFGTLQKWDGLEWKSLETLSLTLDITLGLDDSQKTTSAGEMSRVVVDGVEIMGNYETLFLSEDDEQNISNGLYSNRDMINNGGLYRCALENPNGEAIYVEGNINFYGEELTREFSGWRFSTSFQFLRTDANPNIKCTIKNTYKENLADKL